MATDFHNQKICRIPPEKDSAFAQSIPAAGSIYFRAGTSTLVVGDGQTAGGNDFVSKTWVLQQIADANWKVISSQEAFKVMASAENRTGNASSADSYLSPSVFLGFNVFSSATKG